MGTVTKMTTTLDPALDTAKLADCIEACLECMQTCTACASACVREDGDMVSCIETCTDCADICELTVRMLSRHPVAPSPALADVVELCARACARCAEECESHAASMVHCRVCADACTRCERACQQLLTQMAAAG